jgi:hypothetical protein
MTTHNTKFFKVYFRLDDFEGKKNNVQYACLCVPPGNSPVIDTNSYMECFEKEFSCKVSLCTKNEYEKNISEEDRTDQFEGVNPDDIDNMLHI